MSTVEVLYVMIGGAIGTVIRYGIAKALANVSTTFPISTSLFNASGCFLLGIIVGLGDRFLSIPRSLIAAGSMGFCGGLTTFSTFMADIVKLIEGGHWGVALVYFILSIIVGGALFYTGRLLTTIK